MSTNEFEDLSEFEDSFENDKPVEQEAAAAVPEESEQVRRIKARRRLEELQEEKRLKKLVDDGFDVDDY